MTKNKFRTFVQGTLIQELDSLFNEGGEERIYRYHLFILIAIGIEVLGGALDNKSWHERNQANNRYRLALSSYDSLKKYKHPDLYERLRCGMAHSYIPKEGLGINMKSECGEHNSVNNGKLLLTIEDFFKDFKEACQDLIDNIDGKKDNLNIDSKCKQDFLNTP